MISTFIPGILAFIVLYNSFSFLQLLYRNLISIFFFCKLKDIKKFGNWIVITGATDGIGKAFAELLAKEGYNLVLISRTDQHLQDVKKDLLLKHPQIEIIVIKADFSQIDIYDEIENKIKGLSVGMLINNVGMSYTHPSFLIDDLTSNQFASNLINCNCLSMVLMTKLVLKAGMIKKGGFIINISSAFSLVPAPFLSIYAASKSFVDSFTLSMQSELKESKVTVQNVAPLVVATKMSKARASVMAPSAKSFADSVLNRLGTSAYTHGCFIHELQGWFVRRVPNFILERVIHSSLLKVRSRALKKSTKEH